MLPAVERMPTPLLPAFLAALQARCVGARGAAAPQRPSLLWAVTAHPAQPAPEAPRQPALQAPRQPALQAPRQPVCAQPPRSTVLQCS